MSRATAISLTNVKPEMRQKGKREKRLKIKLNKNEGISPGSRRIPDKRKRNKRERRGVREKARFILAISFRVDFPASAAPAADVMSHEPRYNPEISS